MKSLAMVVGVVLGLAAYRADALSVVLEQSPADPFSAGTFFSDLDHPRSAATPFFLTSSASVASLVWWGGYFGLGPAPADGSSAFVIRLYATNGFGKPESHPLHEVAVTASVSAIAAIVPSFRFEATLPAALDIPAGILLWLAIVDVDPTRPTFAWRKSTEYGTSYSRAEPGFPWNETSGLGSFRLEGTAVPEPGTGVLALLGLSVLAIRSRRRAIECRRPSDEGR